MFFIGSPLVREPLAPDHETSVQSQYYSLYGITTPESVIRVIHRDLEPVSVLLREYGATGEVEFEDAVIVAPYTVVDIPSRLKVGDTGTVVLHSLSSTLIGEVLTIKKNAGAEVSRSTVALTTGVSSTSYLLSDFIASKELGARTILVQNLESEESLFEVTRYSNAGEVLGRAQFSVPAMGLFRQKLSPDRSSVRIRLVPTQLPASCQTDPSASGARVSDGARASEGCEPAKRKRYRAYVKVESPAESLHKYADIQESQLVYGGAGAMLPVYSEGSHSTRLELFTPEQSRVKLSFYRITGEKLNRNESSQLLKNACGMRMKDDGAIITAANVPVICKFDTEEELSHITFSASSDYVVKGNYFSSTDSEIVTGFSTAHPTHAQSYEISPAYFTPHNTTGRVGAYLYTYGWHSERGNKALGYFGEGVSELLEWGTGFIEPFSKRLAARVGNYPSGVITALVTKKVSLYEMIEGSGDGDAGFEVFEGLASVHTLSYADSDGDGLSDAQDGCIFDAAKGMPSGCGCNRKDTENCEEEHDPFDESNKKFDINGDGRVDSEDLESGDALRDLNGDGVVDERDRELLENVIEADIDGNGRIDRGDVTLLAKDFGESGKAPGELVGDIDRDGDVDDEDIEYLRQAYRAAVDPSDYRGDMNGDGVVDKSDIIQWNEHYGTDVSNTSYGDADGSGHVDDRDLIYYLLESTLSGGFQVRVSATFPAVRAGEEFLLSGDTTLLVGKVIVDDPDIIWIVEDSAGGASSSFSLSLIADAYAEETPIAEVEGGNFVAHRGGTATIYAQSGSMRTTYTLIIDPFNLGEELPVEETEFKYYSQRNDICSLSRSCGRSCALPQHPAWIFGFEGFKNVEGLEDYPEDEYMSRLTRRSHTKHINLHGHRESFDSDREKVDHSILVPNILAGRADNSTIGFYFDTLKMLLSTSLETLWVQGVYRWQEDGQEMQALILLRFNIIEDKFINAQIFNPQEATRGRINPGIIELPWASADDTKLYSAVMPGAGGSLGSGFLQFRSYTMGDDEVTVRDVEFPREDEYSPWNVIVAGREYSANPLAGELMIKYRGPYIYVTRNKKVEEMRIIRNPGSGVQNWPIVLQETIEFGRADLSKDPPEVETLESFTYDYNYPDNEFYPDPNLVFDVDGFGSQIPAFRLISTRSNQLKDEYVITAPPSATYTSTPLGEYYEDGFEITVSDAYGSRSVNFAVRPTWDTRPPDYGVGIYSTLEELESWENQEVVYSSPLYGKKSHLINPDYVVKQVVGGGVQGPDNSSTYVNFPYGFSSDEHALPHFIAPTLGGDVVALSYYKWEGDPEDRNGKGFTGIFRHGQLSYEFEKTDGSLVDGIYSGKNGVFFLPFQWNPDYLKTTNAELKELIGRFGIFSSIVSDGTSELLIPEYGLEHRDEDDCLSDLSLWKMGKLVFSDKYVIDPHRVPPPSFFHAKDCVGPCPCDGIVCSTGQCIDRTAGN